MRNYTLIKDWSPSEGNFVLAYRSWTKQFLIPLAYDVKSLYDYWLYFKPNYEEVAWESFQNEFAIVDKKLPIEALNYRQYVYITQNNLKASFRDSNNSEIMLPAGAIVVSNVMPVGINDSSNNDRKNINNYIVQYTSSADYYQYSINRKDQQYFFTASFTENAGELYGGSFIIQIPCYFPRFYYITGSSPWAKENSGKTLLAFYVDEEGYQHSQIQDKEELIFQPYLAITHRMFINSTNNLIDKIDGDEIIVDTIASAFNNEIDNIATPSYNITINNNEQQILFDGIQIELY